MQFYQTELVFICLKKRFIEAYDFTLDSLCIKRGL